MPGRLVVEQVRTSDLLIDPRNARTHPKRQIRQIASSIRAFGFVNPVLIDEANRLIAGHGRLEAARLLGLEQVPAIRLRHLSEARKRALVLADNRIALSAGWDETLLAQELRYLTEIEVDFDVSVTGFEVAEIDLMIESLDPAEADPAADQIPETIAPEDVTTRHGDLWLLGKHRLLCGDATKADDFDRLMAGKKAQMVFVDPPYNLRIDGHVCGSGRIKHREFPMASGEMTEAQFTAFLDAAFSNLAAHSVNGSIHFACMDWRHIHELLSAGRRVYSELKNLCVWAKGNAGMGSLYRSQHELIFVFKHEPAHSDDRGR